MPRWIVALLALGACETSTVESRCIDDGKILIYSDVPPSSTPVPIGCVTFEEWQKMNGIGQR